MRKIVILRGAQGAGKSTFIKKQGLEGFALSPDSIRMLMGGIIMSPEGRIGINPTNDKKVWEEIKRILDEKMARGEFIVFDATFQRARDFKMPVQLANKHRYEIYCVDFSSVPPSMAMERNLQRESYKQVPEEVVTRAYERFAESKIPQDITVFSYSDFDQQSLVARLDIKPVDLNAYKKIHHIGDLQGCYEPVAEYFANGFKDDEFYIFVGDFLDRGIQNGEVIRWLVDHVIDRPNVIMVWGNHETHIHRYATGQTTVSKEFQYNTFPQLQKVNFTKHEANRLCSKLVDCFVYHYGQTKCLVTHAGIAAVPEHIVLIPSHQFWKGTGTYEFPVDQTFSDNMAKTEWIQVHGHRNSKLLPVKATAKSYNLEAEVEFGGNQRIMTLTQNGVVEEIEIRNNIFRKQGSNTSTHDTITNEGHKISQLSIDSLRAHDFVNCKKFVTYPHITSYNFTRKAFTKGIWDQVSLTARGLFVDDGRHIVARSYNKFFNLEERPETEWRNLQKSLTFPLTLWVKENGFLGLLGYDIASEKLFFASKSTPESPFAQWFKEILTESVGESRLEYLRRTVRDRNLSLVFEVNDPVNDPHMIEYDKRHVVLLDAVYRTEQFKRLEFPELQQFAASYNIPCKQKGIIFKDWNSFKGWYENMDAQGQNYTFKGKHVEGFVIEDSNGFMFKIKLPYYSFWKYMRSLKDRIIKMRETGGDLRRDISSPEALAFYEWAMTQPNEVLEKDIITLRKSYLASFG
ncbi:MAG: RNA ligase [Gammaproteobacteria bacterium]